MINATVAILTLNSDKHLDNCLKSVKSFRERLILDGGSTDKTINIAKKYSCKIIKQPKKFRYKNKKIKNFSKLKNLILKVSKFNLILFLDSDEYLNKSIIKKINFYSKSSKSQNKYYSFLIGRFPIFKNKLIKQKTLLYPNFQERLVYKSNVKYFTKPVHERPLKKYNHLSTKKIEGVSIKFPVNSDKNILLKKHKYYYEIEKKSLSRSPNIFIGLKFIFFRLLVIMKFLIKDFFLNSNNYDRNFRKFELENLKLNTCFAFKLLKNVFWKNA